jgi:[ribosomal protein S5]-alanine N-acetyltransferase
MPLLVPPVVPAGTMADRVQPSLPADSLRLRPLVATDSGWLIEAYQDPQIQRWHLRRFDSVEEVGRWIRRWESAWAAETDVRWAITDDADRPLGSVGLRGISLPDGYAEISYWVLPAARRSGVAGRAVAAMVGWAVDELGLARLEIRHSTANQASCAVANRLDFPLEATLTRALRHQDGFHDLHLHARLGPAAFNRPARAGAG